MSDTSLVHDTSTNLPDYAAEETDRLEREFVDLQREVHAALDEARALPKEVDDKTVADQYTSTIARLRDLNDRVEGVRISEGLPYLRKTGAVNSFFFALREKLARRNKTDNPGAVDVLAARLHAYNERRRLEEQRKRDEEARIAREAEERAAAQRREAERLQREAEEKAARARKAENREAAEAAARAAEAAAAKAREEEESERARRQDAEAATRAKPGDLIRERGEGGTLNTMKRVPYVEMVDSMKLDAKALWPFVSDKEKERALKTWAKTTQHRQMMDGAIIEMRNETVVRR